MSMANRRNKAASTAWCARCLKESYEPDYAFVLSNTVVVTGRVAMITIALVTLDTVLYTLWGVE